MSEKGKRLILSAIFFAASIMVFTGSASASQDEMVFGDFKYEDAFKGYKITGYTGKDTSISIPEEINGVKVTEIYRDAFSGCDTLVEVRIPEGIYKIGTFESDTVNMFNDCSKLERIIVDEANQTYCSIDGAVYDKKKTQLLICPKAIGGITIPESVQVLSENVFTGCTQLKSLFIPANVENIGEEFLNQYAFSVCSGLEEITVSEENMDFSSENGMLFDKYKTVLLYCPGGKTDVEIPEGIESIGKYAFSGCSKIKKIVIPEEIEEIDEDAFENCSELTEIDLPDSLMEIQQRAFCGCTRLKSITMPAGIQFIDPRAFAGCNLDKVIIPESNDNYRAENGILYNKAMTEIIACFNKDKTSVMIPDSVKSIGMSAGELQMGGGFEDCIHLKEIMIPDTVEEISAYAFSGCTGLRRVVLPDGITEIKGSVFSGCSSLTEINIPQSVTYIDSFAFSHCSSLKNIVIPNGVTQIDSAAFWYCNNLESIIIPDSVTMIGDGSKCEAFRQCNKLTIYCSEDSFACQYSKDFGIPYKIIDYNGTVAYLSADKRCKEYHSGDTLNTDDLTVKAVYPDGTEKAVKGYSTNAGEIDMTATGKKTLIISYTENDINYITYIPIKVIKNFETVECSIVSSAVYTYDGYAKTPEVAVKDNGILLSQGKDYSVNYRNNINAGTAMVVIEGRGVYGGTKYLSFNIKKAKQEISASNVKKYFVNKKFWLNVNRITGNGKLTYSCADKRVAVVDAYGKVMLKGYGKTYITITAAENSNYQKTSERISVIVYPKKVQIKNAVSKGKGRLEVSWQKDSRADGYKILYVCGNTKKTKMVSKKSVTKATLKNLKQGKKYKVSVCSYKNAGKKKLYGKYSLVKTVIINKK